MPERIDGVEFRGPGLDWWTSLFRVQRNGENIIRPDGVGRDILMYPTVQPVIDVSDLANSPFPGSQDYRRAVQVYNPFDTGKEVPLVITQEPGSPLTVITPPGTPLEVTGQGVQAQRIFQLEGSGSVALPQTNGTSVSRLTQLGALGLTGLEAYGILEDVTLGLFANSTRVAHLIPTDTLGLASNGDVAPGSFYATTTLEFQYGPSQTDDLATIRLAEVVMSHDNNNNTVITWNDWVGPRFIIPLIQPNGTYSGPSLRLSVSRENYGTGAFSAVTFYYDVNFTIRAWNSGDPSYPFSGTNAGVTWQNVPLA